MHDLGRYTCVVLFQFIGVLLQIVLQIAVNLAETLEFVIFVRVLLDHLLFFVCHVLQIHKF